MQQPSDTAPPNRSSALLAPLSDWFRSGDKVLRFAVLGAVGCVVGAVLGELLLLATRQPVVTVSPQAVCLLIDCSGSMFFDAPPGRPLGQKVREVKSAAREFVERQKDNLKRDRIAVLGFGSMVHVAAGLSGDADELARAIRGLDDRGNTAMHEALGAAAQELQLSNMPEEFRKQSPIRSILLFTDGQPDNESAALEAARSCRDQGIKIVAIGTGDAKMAYLEQITGNPKLVFHSDAGNFGEGFEKAEQAIYGPSLVESTGTQAGFFAELLRIGGWTALVALGVALALIIGQNLYLHRTPLTAQEALIGILGGLGAGIVGGAAGQLFLAAAFVTAKIPVLGTILGWLIKPLGRILGWAILGVLLGRGLAFFVPNLEPRRACIGGGIGGAAAAVAFLMASLLSDVVGRFLGAAILGAFIGMMIALMEAVFRKLWLEVRYGQKEVVRVSLGAVPVRIGSDNRTCTIWARGARPLAVQYQVVEGRVMCLDYATETSTVVQPGDQRVIGHVTVTVRAAHEKAAAASADAAIAAPVPAAPAAPPPARIKSPSTPPVSPAPAAPAPPAPAPAAVAPGATLPAPPPHKRAAPAADTPQPKPAAPAAPTAPATPVAPATPAGSPLAPPPPPRKKQQSPPAPGGQPRSIRPVPPPEKRES
jgi:Ca-activated chloride channel family protein